MLLDAIACSGVVLKVMPLHRYVEVAGARGTMAGRRSTRDGSRRAVGRIG